MRGRRAIGGGRAPLRRALYCTTSAAIIWNPPLRAYYDHLSSNGKQHKVAWSRPCAASADAERHHQDRYVLELAMPGKRLNSTTAQLPTSPQAGYFNRSQSLWTLWAISETFPRT